VHRFLEAVSLALQAIWANKLRALLTVLGNIVAVTSIIAVVSLVRGLDVTVSETLTSAVGADAFTINQAQRAFTMEQMRDAARNPIVTIDDVEAVRAAGPPISLVMAEAVSRAQVKYRDRTADSVTIQGVTREFAQLSTTNVERGRLMTTQEFDQGRNVAFLGWDAADRLFETLDPIDKTVVIQGMHFRVVGVAEPKGSIMGQSRDSYVVVPLGAFQRAFGTRLSLTMTVVPTGPDAIEQAMDEATLAMRVHRRLRPADPNNFGIFSADTFLEIYRIATAGLFTILIGVVSLSLVVGGIVIMNIMLMVVTERTREIGLRKSLGARRKDIIWQILTESIALSTFGGILGTAMGFGIAYFISLVSPLPAVVETWSVALGIGMTAAVGLFFGLYPAMRAASLDPIEALRRE
jgi:putative ABC transport system permease protein